MHFKHDPVFWADAQPAKETNGPPVRRYHGPVLPGSLHGNAGLHADEREQRQQENQHFISAGHRPGAD